MSMLNLNHSVKTVTGFSSSTQTVVNSAFFKFKSYYPVTKKLLANIVQFLIVVSLLFGWADANAQCSPDVTAPVITCPSNISTNVNSGFCSASVTVPIPTVTDNCQKSYSLTFAGGSQVVSVPNNTALQLTGNFTIEAWFRVTTASSDWVRVVGKGDATNRNYGLWYSSVHNTLLFQTYATGGAYYNAQISFTPALNTWYHVAGVKNGSTYTLYLNGVAQTSVTGANTPLTSTDPLTLGGSTAMHTRHIGQIDNVRLWNTAFTAAQMASAYNGILAGPSANLVAHYNMEANIGTTTLKDMGPNSLNGTLSGGMTSGAFTTNNSPVGAAWVTNNINSTSDASGTYPVGTSSVVWTARDLAGNTSTCTQTITVVDNISPTITCPANITVTAPSGSCNVAVNYSTPVATDNCSGCSSAPAISGFASLGVYNGFAYYVSTSTFTGPNAFADAATQGGQVVTVSSAAENSWIRTSANSAGYTGSLLIGINDVATEGVWVGGSNETVSYFNWNSGEPNNSGNEDYVQILGGTGVWNDIGSGWAGSYILKKACLTPVRIAGLASGSNFPVGVNTVTYQATDAAGNSSNCSFTVTVNDVTPPAITCPSTQTLNLNSSCTAVVPDYRSLASVSDNCTTTGSITLTQSPAPGTTITGSGTTSVKIIATDASGNADSCSFSLIKADIIPPVITCNGDINVNADAGLCGALVTYTISATDECSGFCTPGTLSGYTLLGTYGGHTYYKSNTNSNWSTASAAATAAGGHLVTINSSGENSFLSSAGVCWTGMMRDPGNPTTWIWATGEPVTYTNWNAGEPNNSGGSENYMHVNYSVAGGWNDISGSGSYAHIVEFECLNTTMTSGLVSGSIFPIGTTTVTYTATDAGGNTSTCSFNVTVVDNIAPSVASPNFTATAAAGECSAIVNYGTPMPLDNCGNCGSAAAITGYTALGVYNGYAYYISNSTMTPPVAFTTANSLGGQVATINSAAENTWVRTAVNAASGFGSVVYVIGQNDVTTEGTFAGGSGETVSYSNWNSGEPNNSGGVEDYTQVYTGAGVWNDIGPGGSYYYILKKACLTPTLTSGLASGSSFPVGTSTVNYSVTDASGNSGTGSFTVTVSLNPTSIGKVVNPSPSTICEGSGANVNIGASESGISYQLRINGSNTPVGSPVTGTGGTINLPTGIIYATTTYNILATNPLNGCSYQLTNTATVNVNPAPAAPTVTNGSRCGSGTVALSVTPGSGNTTDWYSAATGGSAFLTGNNNYTTPAIATTTTYYVVARNTGTGCTTLTRTAITATVNSLPASPTVTAGSRCGSGSVSLSATAGSGETIDWYSAASGGTALATGTGFYNTPVISSTTNYYAESRNTTTGCKSASRTLVVATVNAIPTAPTGTGASRCGPGSITISASVGSGFTVDWYAASAGGTALQSGSTTYSPSITGTTSFYAESRNTTTGCVSATRTTVVATMNPLPAAPAGTDGGRCSSGTVTLSASPGSGNTIDWYAAASGGTALVSGNNNFTTPTISVTTVYYAQTRNNTTGCTSSTRTAVTATVSNPVAPTAGSNSRCGSGVITITATPGTGETIDWYAAATGGTALVTGNTSYSPTVTTTTTFYAQARHATYGCLSSTRTAVVATVNAIPAVPTGTGASRCGTGSVTISASAGAGETIDWYAASSGGTALQTGSTSYTSSISSTTTYYAESRNTTTGCVSATRTAITATVNSLPAAPSGGNFYRCGPGTITLTSTPGVGETIDWFTNLTDVTPVASGTTTYTTPYQASGSVTYWAQSRNLTTGCAFAGKTAVIAVVNNLPPAPTANNGSRCGPGTVNLSVSSGGYAIDWYDASSGGTLLVSGSPLFTTPSILTTTTFYAEARNSTTGCLSSTRTAVVATVNSLPAAPVGIDNSRCGSGSITVSATAGTGETIYWWNAASGGTSYGTGNNLTRSVTTTTTFYAESRNSNGCISASRTAVVATVNSLPSAATGTNASRCGAGSITITASAGTGQTIDWYAASTGGTALTSGSTSFTTTVSSTTNFYAETRNTTTGCVSGTRTPVTAIVNTIPSAPTAINGSRCGTGTVNISVASGGYDIYWYDAATGGTLLSSSAPMYTTPVISSTTVYYAEARTLPAGCPSATRTAVTATVNANSTISLTSGTGSNSQTTCVYNAINNITYSVGGSGTGATVTGLPTGVTGNFSGGVFTISGIPTVNGSFGYTVTTTGPCTNVTATGTLNISAATVPGSIANVSVCYGDNGSLTLSGNNGSVIRWEKSLDNGNTWTNISNSTNTESFSNATSTILYRALVQNGSCGTQVYTANATVGIHNLWTGAVSSDWSNPANWSDGSLPTSSCPEVTIPQLNLPNVYPQITSGPVQVNNLIIYPSATLNVSNVTLQVSGSITNNGTLDISNGTLELNGTTGAQTIAGSLFNTNSVKNLIISNSNGVSLSGTNDTLKITGTISFGKSNCVLTTNGNLTLISNASGTASVADMTDNGNYSGNDIIGNVNVERFIPNHPKAWQFLSVPTKGFTIKQAWQEGSSGVSSNLKPGYGTIITSNLASALALGFDIYTPSGPTMKTYNPSTNGWDGVSSTTNPIANKKGYMVFVRGDRSVTTSSAPATNVILRTTGQLYTKGVNAPDVTTVPAGKFESIGNPYPATIDFRKISKSAAPDVADVFYVWDPLLTNVYAGLGGYQTISAVNGWKPVPGGTANFDASVPHPYILSGQAFFVHSMGNAGSVSFAENNKVNTVADAFRIASTPDERSFFRASMTTAADVMSDGNVVSFDDIYSNSYDADDALKIVNSSENFAIKRFGINMAIEARKSVQSADTIFYNISNMRAGGYKLKFAPSNMAGENLIATLVDKHLGTFTPISLADSTVVPFSVTAAASGSYAADRFYVIFKSMVVLPVKISKVTAIRTSNNSVTVKWQTESEINMHQYEVERSFDGRNFSSIASQQPKANNAGGATYVEIDKNASTGENFYRIKAVSSDGTIQFSEVVKVAAIEKQTDISVFPNPVEDKRLNIHFKNVKTGVYYVQLVNAAGQVVYKRKLEITSPNSTEILEAGDKLAAGNYQLKLNTDDGSSISLQVIVR